jgi:hypothetical protein
MPDVGSVIPAIAGIYAAGPRTGVGPIADGPLLELLAGKRPLVGCGKLTHIMSPAEGRGIHHYLPLVDANAVSR